MIKTLIITVAKSLSMVALSYAAGLIVAVFGGFYDGFTDRDIPHEDIFFAAGIGTGAALVYLWLNERFNNWWKNLEG